MVGGFNKTRSLGRMRMEWVKHNSVDKQKLLTEKIFSRDFQVLLLTRFS